MLGGDWNLKGRRGCATGRGPRDCCHVGEEGIQFAVTSTLWFQRGDGDEEETWRMAREGRQLGEREQTTYAKTNSTPVVAGSEKSSWARLSGLVSTVCGGSGGMKTLDGGAGWIRRRLSNAKEVVAVSTSAGRATLLCTCPTVWFESGDMDGSDKGQCGSNIYLLDSEARTC